MSPDVLPQMAISLLLNRAVKEAAEHTKATGKKISCDKLLPYVVKTLPLLVKCALAGEPTTYSQISKEIGAGSPQNGNRAFKAIALALDALGKDKTFRGNKPIPDLTSIVTRAGSSMSGSGAFLAAPETVKRSAEEKVRWLETQRQGVYAYSSNWLLVLDALGLPELPNLEPNLDTTPPSTPQGENQLHKNLKALIAMNPRCVYLEMSPTFKAETEYIFWSDDRIDVSLVTPHEWLGVEVKTSKADYKELQRGIFQVLKYQALLRGTILMRGERKGTTCVLALGGSLPAPLIQLAKRVGVKYVENLEAHAAFIDRPVPHEA